MDTPDITKIALSPAELKKLRWISKNGPIEMTTTSSDPVIDILFDRGLLESTYSDKFPYSRVSGIVGIPRNAFEVSDLGRQYLNLVSKQSKDAVITRIIAIWGAITGTVAIVVEIWLHFQ